MLSNAKVEEERIMRKPSFARVIAVGLAGLLLGASVMGALAAGPPTPRVRPGELIVRYRQPLAFGDEAPGPEEESPGSFRVLRPGIHPAGAQGRPESLRALDRRFGTQPGLMIAGLVVGLAGGALAAYRLVTGFLRS